MRFAPLLMLVVGCTSNTSFSHQTPDVPVVEGNGEMEYSPLELVWTDLEVGTTISQELVLTSVGELNLSVYEVRVTDTGNGTFYTEELEDRLLATGSSLSVLVVATLKNERMAEGTLRIQSNDADLLDLEVPLIAYPLGFEQDSGADSAP